MMSGENTVNVIASNDVAKLGTADMEQSVNPLFKKFRRPKLSNVTNADKKKQQEAKRSKAKAAKATRRKQRGK